LCGDNTAVLEIDKLGSEGIRGGISNRLETDSCDRNVEWSIFKDSYISSYLETMSWRGIFELENKQEMHTLYITQPFNLSKPEVWSWTKQLKPKIRG